MTQHTPFSLKAYLVLAKPGIILGNAVTAVAGFLLGARGAVDYGLLGMLLLGLSCIIGCGCAINHYLDQERDQKMTRTQKRPLVTGVLSDREAIAFGVALGLLGSCILGFYVNALALWAALLGLFVYLVPYTFFKYTTSYGTLVGSIAGAMPPVIGYAAATGRIDLGALLLFLIIMFWQMPHFYAIALYRLREYAAAEIPVLPLRRGAKTTKVHMLCYTLALLCTVPLLFTFHYVTLTYLLITLPLVIWWAWLCLQGFRCTHDGIWARKVFIRSLVVVNGLSFAVPFAVST
jgi:protoheme IX farnesyltransferase